MLLTIFHTLKMNRVRTVVCFTIFRSSQNLSPEDQELTKLFEGIHASKNMSEKTAMALTSVNEN